jgi:5-methylcytosine-specific restriction endonuclease McrA
MATKKKATKRASVPRTRAGGRWTENEFWGFVRSGLRKISQRWAPVYDALNNSKRKSRSANKRLKWEHQCNECKQWFPRKLVSVDHVVPAGSLKTYADLPGFVERLLCEEEGLQVLCKCCHDAKTKQETNLRKRK